MTGPTFTAVTPLAEVPQGSVKRVAIGGLSILLIHTADGIFAVENRCSHAEQPLECGRVKNGWISCPTHGARFDLETGEPLGGPAELPIATFAVRVAEDMIEVAA